MYLSALFGVVALLALAIPRARGVDIRAAGFEIPAPNPNGMPWKVAHNRSSLVDKSRKDPYNSSQDRKVAYSIFMPIHQDTCTGTADNVYMPNLTAKASNLQFFDDENANVFEQLKFESCTSASGETPGRMFPLVIVEPAVGTSRFLYNQFARQLSANGAYVVTIDHAHDAPIVEFANADPIKNDGDITLDPFKVNRPWDDEIKKAVKARIGDINAVIKEIESNNAIAKLFPGVKFEANNKVPNTKKIHIFGHGGSVATEMGATDPKVVWTMNLFGTAPAIKNDTLSHTIFFGREDYRSEDDPAWIEAKKHFRGYQAEWTYFQADQFDYSDLPLVAAIVDPNKKAKGLGTPFELINSGPAFTFHALSCFTEAYLRDNVLQGWPARLPGIDGIQLHRCLSQFGSAMKPHMHKR